MENQNVELQLGTILDRAVAVGKKYGGWVLLLNVVSYMANQLASQSLNQAKLMSMIETWGNTGDFAKAAKVMNQADDLSQIGATFFILLLVGILLSVFIDMVVKKILWKGVNDEGKVNLTEMLKESFNTQYFNYLFAVILVSIITGFGTCCCILPGIFLAVRLLFVPIIVANNPQVSAIDALSLSWDLTRGRFWTLLGYGCVAFGLNILGFCCCCVGLYVSSVLTAFMMAECYRILVNSMTEEPVESFEYQKQY